MCIFFTHVLWVCPQCTPLHWPPSTHLNLFPQHQPQNLHSIIIPTLPVLTDSLSSAHLVKHVPSCWDRCSVHQPPLASETHCSSTTSLHKLAWSLHHLEGPKSGYMSIWFVLMWQCGDNLTSRNIAARFKVGFWWWAPDSRWQVLTTTL